MLASLDHVDEAMAVGAGSEATWEARHQVEYQTILVVEPLLRLEEVARRPGELVLGVGVRLPFASVKFYDGLANLCIAPAWSGNAAKTPMWRPDASAGGSRTPAYAGADGSRTVNPYNDGSRTVNPYGGNTAYGGPSNSGSGRTPAWNPTATSSSYTHDPFSNNTGGRTPAYEPSYSRTPGPSYNTPGASSRAYDAPTPGKDFNNAPTPSAHPMNAYGNAGNTPAAMGGAPTPKFSGDAPTPYGGQPETPGWAGGGDTDDGPRYEEATPSP